MRCDNMYGLLDVTCMQTCRPTLEYFC